MSKDVFELQKPSGRYKYIVALVGVVMVLVVVQVVITNAGLKKDIGVISPVNDIIEIQSEGTETGPDQLLTDSFIEGLIGNERPSENVTISTEPANYSKGKNMDQFLSEDIFSEVTAPVPVRVAIGSKFDAVLMKAATNVEPLNKVLAKIVDGPDLLKGSILVGKGYELDGYNRLFINFFKLVRPDGTELGISATAMGPDLELGLVGDIDQHWDKKVLSGISQGAISILGSVLDPITESVSGQINNGSVPDRTIKVQKGHSFIVFLEDELKIKEV